MNCFTTNESLIFDYVLKKLNLSKKTKTFWNYLFDNILVPPDVLMNYASNSSYDTIDIYKKQIQLAKQYNEKIEDFIYYNEMIESIIKHDISTMKKELEDSEYEIYLEELINLYSKEQFKRVITKYNYIITDNISEKLIIFFDINELYKMGIVNENLIKEHLDDFDRNLLFEFGVDKLSVDFIYYLYTDMELLNMADIPIEQRPNIGFNKSPLYLNGGCCLGEKHYNGVDIYFPYGAWVDIFRAIEISSRCISKQIETLRESINRLDSDNKDNNPVIETLISNLAYDIEDLKNIK